MKNLDNVTNVWGKVDERRHEVLEVSVQGMRNRWPLGFPLVKFRNAAGEEYAHSFKDNVQSNKVRVELNDRDVKRAGVCVMTVEWHEKGRVVASREYMGLIEGKKMEKPKYEAIGGEEDCGGGNGGGGLPEGGEPYKALVTDSNGNTVWEDRLAFMTDDWVNIAPTQYINTYNNASGVYYTNINASRTLLPGKRYKVVWDGIEREFDAIAEGNGVAIGDLEMYEDGINDGTQFIVTNDFNDPDMLRVMVDLRADHSIAVYVQEKVAKPIDPEYIGGWKALGEKTENVTLTFDGNTDGLETVVVSENFSLVKISDDIPAKENMIGAVLTVAGEKLDITENDIIDQGSGSYAVTELMLVVSDYTADSTVAVTSNGIWLAKADEMYISKLEYTGTVYTPIPKAYLPEDIGGGVVRVLVSMDENDEYVASHTYAEIVKAFTDGKRIECIYGDYVLQLCSLTGASGYSTFDADGGIAIFNCVCDRTIVYVNIPELGFVIAKEYTVTTT